MTRDGIPTFGLGTLLLLLAVLAGCLALARHWPLMAILLAAVAAAGLVRTGHFVRRAHARGEQPGNGAKLVLFMASLALVVMTVGIILAASAALALVGWLAGRGLQAVLAEPWIPVLCMAWGLVTGLPIGVFAALRILGRQFAAELI
jgi:hypothetical protein